MQEVLYREHIETHSLDWGEHISAIYLPPDTKMRSERVSGNDSARRAQGCIAWMS